MLIPYLMAYLLHYFYNLKTKYKRQKLIAFLKSAWKKYFEWWEEKKLGSYAKISTSYTKINKYKSLVSSTKKMFLTSILVFSTEKLFLNKF